MRIPIKKSTIDISVVIPALHEAPNLRKLLPLLRETFDAMEVAWEVLVVDGESGDGTDQVLAEMGEPFRYVCETASGYGRAIMRGATEAQGEFVLTMDADMSHPTEFIRHLWDARQQGDIVIASRYVAGGKADQPWFRYKLSQVLNHFFGIGLSMAVRDMSSGYRLYRKSLFAQLDLEFTNFVILVEILLKAFANGKQIYEVPFHYRPRDEGGSHARILHFGMDYLRLFHRMWRIRNSIEFPDYDWRAHDSRIWFQRYWQRSRHRIILGFTSANTRVCDVGCGSSRILADLPDAVGLDLRHDKLAFMRKVNKALVQGSGMELPFPDESFACVICSEVIEHIPEEDGRLIQELTRVLKPGGILIIGTPDYGNWQWRLIERIYDMVAPGAYGDEHVTQYTFETLCEALRHHGYEVEDHAYICRSELIIKARRPQH